jgi:sugar O-acyltransferase (sialic acid O-acetyltransferase NeuD family)
MNDSVQAKPPNSVVIVGAGGFGLNIASLARSDSAFGIFWDLKGFLDDRTDLFQLADLPIIGEPHNYLVEEGDIFLCALGNPHHKQKYTENLRAQGANFFNLCPDMNIGERTVLGRGGIYERRVSIGPDVRLGDFVTILSTTIVGYRVRIGSYCQIGSFVFVGGGAVVGELVTIHPHSTILPGVVVGDGATIGAGSVVISDVPPNTTVMGKPAKPFVYR